VNNPLSRWIIRSVSLVFLHAFILAGLASSGTAQVNQYYVSPTGSDSNNGTSATTAWQTVNHADAALALGPDGTVVHVAAGTYTGASGCYNSGLSAVFCISHGGTSDTRRVTYISDTKWGAIVSGGQVSIIGQKDRAGTTPEGAPWGQYVTFQDFQVGPYASDGQGIDTRGAHTDIVGNYVHDIGTNGTCFQSGGIVQIPNGGSAVGGLIDGNLIVRVGWSTSLQNQSCNTEHGIYPSFAGVVVSNNVVIGAASKGIQYGGEGACQGVIANNTLIGNGEVGIIMNIGSGDPICQGVSDYDTFANNLCVDNGQQAADHGPSDACVRIYSTTGTHNVVRNNIIANGSPNAVNLCGSQGANPASGCGVPVAASGNQAISTAGAQLFVHYQMTGGGDYHLLANAPVVGKGDAMSALSSLVSTVALTVFQNALNTDFDDVTRPVPPSTGAYEPASSGPSQPAQLTPPSGLTVSVQ
jgi:hypothetical protein